LAHDALGIERGEEKQVNAKRSKKVGGPRKKNICVKEEHNPTQNAKEGKCG